jgi:hypothetical protein
MAHVRTCVGGWGLKPRVQHVFKRRPAATGSVLRLGLLLLPQRLFLLHTSCLDSGRSGRGGGGCILPLQAPCCRCNSKMMAHCEHVFGSHKAYDALLPLAWD